MTWRITGGFWTEHWDDKGAVGGFARDVEGELGGTGIGPIYSPDGKQWYIIVDNAGNVKSTLIT